MNSNTPLPKHDKLSELLDELPLDSPSLSFESTLKRRLDKEVEQQEERRLGIGFAVSIACILLTIGGVGYILLSTHMLSVSFQLPAYNLPAINTQVVILAAGILVLLLSDLLMRKHAVKRKKKTQ